MILILSDKFDQSTNAVIDWLLYFNYPFFRINENDLCEITEISIGLKDKIILKVNNKTIDFDEISHYWYRRGEFNIQIPNFLFTNEVSMFEEEIDRNTKEEVITIVEFLNVFLNGKKNLGSYFDNFTNKLSNLKIAKSCGLSIPETLISSKKELVKKFYDEENKKIITKALSQTIMFSKPEGAIRAYTNNVDSSSLNKYKTNIFPSLFQKAIEKKYELRIFFIENTFYSMAIFSQTNKKTQVDFRKYDRNRPNRNVPYILPDYIEKKLLLFIEKNKFKTGSIDMLVTNNDEFVFLEINPVGQFGMTSFPCNYHLHKKIAKYLCQ
ncbi:grasp-with-spasm system ATP-grasp peptide maturase [Tenacibaculum ovolyticum]|uniref:grasp-with-spasm system ATP-grasp peptide maturase n=1 Tax=Tenacibaculum ovolyticum TaxID=104270 RepID=UPI001F3E0F1B|nr:grasp-with-spasm system ATP-grasp peptide maturase [Tenacibaculum ovolyticum]